MKREAVWEAIRHVEGERVPYNIELTGDELERVCTYTGIDRKDFFDWAGNHIEKLAYNGGGRYIREGFFRDEFGVVWNRTGTDKDIGVVDEIIMKAPSIKGYPFPEPDLKKVERDTEKLLKNGRDTFKLGKIGMTYFERAWSLRGMENLLMDFYLEPSFVEALLEAILDYNMKVIDVAVEYDIDGFYFGDDYGQQTGLLMSPETWRRFIKPGLARMFERIKGAGKVTALHSCGYIEAILGDLIDIGLDIYQTLQPEVYDIEKIKREYGMDLTFWGGISTQQLLPYAKPHDLKKAVRDIIDKLSVGGGYIASPTHQVPADVPPENILALVELLRDGSM